MAFAIDKFNNWTSGAATGPRYWAYESTADTLATILAANYFVTVGNALDPFDLIYIIGTDGRGTFEVTSASGTAVTMGPSTDIAVSRVTIPTASVLDLADTPYQLVAAPGAGRILYFEGALLQLDYNSIGYTEAADNLEIKYTNEAGVTVSTLIECTGFIDQTADTTVRALPVLNAIVANSANENAALVLSNINDDFAAGNSPLIVDTYYRIVTGV